MRLHPLSGSSILNNNELVGALLIAVVTCLQCAGRGTRLRHCRQPRVAGLADIRCVSFRLCTTSALLDIAVPIAHERAIDSPTLLLRARWPRTFAESHSSETPEISR